LTHKDCGISWTHVALGSLYGCKECSHGCTNCYAVTRTYRFSANPVHNKDGRFDTLIATKKQKVTMDGVNTEKVVRHFSGDILFNPAHLYAALKVREPRMIFVNEFSDLYHDNVPMNVILEHFRVFEAVPHCTFQILTKRADRLAEVNKAVLAKFGAWPVNVWQGVSVCTGAKVEMRRIDLLGKTQAKVKWVSFEPWISDPKQALKAACPDLAQRLKLNQITWSVIGGESGSKEKSRLMTMDDAQYLFASSKDAGCKLHFKQLGIQLALKLGNYSTQGKGEHRAKGGNPDQIPRKLRKREWPPIPRTKVVRPSSFKVAFDPKDWKLFKG